MFQAESHNAPSVPSSGKSSEMGEVPIPLTLITGFLGAGKSSLIKSVLSGEHGLRIAVIMNEFGESVEEAAFHTRPEVQSMLGAWITLANGCMCCQVKSDFVSALESLMNQEEKAFDYIIVESTGLTNPGPVASSLWSVTSDSGQRVQLDAIITVVDCININRQLHDPRPEGVVNEAQVQIAYADLILLNKMDLCDDEAIVRSEADIRAINSSVPILHTTKCDVDMSHILNRKQVPQEALHVIAEGGEDEEEGGGVALPPVSLQSSDTQATSDGHLLTPREEDAERGRDSRGSAKDAVASWLMDEGLPGSTSGRGLRHAKSRSRSVSRTRRRSLNMDQEHCLDAHTLHDSEIMAISVTAEKPLDLERFKKFMEKLLWDREAHPDDIYRVKGLLSIDGSDTKHQVQAVYQHHSLSPVTQWSPLEVRTSKVVVIGRSLKPDIIQSWLTACQV